MLNQSNMAASIGILQKQIKIQYRHSCGTTTSSCQKLLLKCGMESRFKRLQLTRTINLGHLSVIRLFFENKVKLQFVVFPILVGFYFLAIEDFR